MSVRTKNRDAWRAAGLLALMIRQRQTFTIEDLYQVARERGIAGKTITRIAGNILKGFASVGLVTKTTQYRTSARNSKPLIVWRAQ